MVLNLEVLVVADGSVYLFGARGGRRSQVVRVRETALWQGLGGTSGVSEVDEGGCDVAYDDAGCVGGQVGGLVEGRGGGVRVVSESVDVTNDRLLGIGATSLGVGSLSDEYGADGGAGSGSVDGRRWIAGRWIAALVARARPSVLGVEEHAGKTSVQVPVNGAWTRVEGVLDLREGGGTASNQRRGGEQTSEGEESAARAHCRDSSNTCLGRQEIWGLALAESTFSIGI